MFILTRGDRRESSHVWPFARSTGQTKLSNRQQHAKAVRCGKLVVETNVFRQEAQRIYTKVSLTADLSFRYTVAVTTIWSGASYIYSKDAVKILTPLKDAEKKQGDNGKSG